MANHIQAKKRNRQRIKRTARNRNIRTYMRSTVRRLRVHLDAGDKAEATKALDGAIKCLDTAAIKGILHRRTASRTISRLTMAVNKLA